MAGKFSVSNEITILSHKLTSEKLIIDNKTECKNNGSCIYITFATRIFYIYIEIEFSGEETFLISTIFESRDSVRRSLIIGHKLSTFQRVLQ